MADSMSTKAYLSVYGEPHRKRDGSFGGYDIQITPDRKRFGYWSFAVAGKDDLLAYSRGYLNPEMVLMAAARNERNTEGIFLIWVAGDEEIFKHSRLGAAQTHIKRIEREKILLGKVDIRHLDLPIYNHDPTGSLLNHRTAIHQQQSQPPVSTPKFCVESSIEGVSRLPQPTCRTSPDRVDLPTSKQAMANYHDNPSWAPTPRLPPSKENGRRPVAAAGQQQTAAPHPLSTLDGNSRSFGYIPPGSHDWKSSGVLGHDSGGYLSPYATPQANYIPNGSPAVSRPIHTQRSPILTQDIRGIYGPPPVVARDQQNLYTARWEHGQQQSPLPLYQQLPSATRQVNGQQQQPARAQPPSAAHRVYGQQQPSRPVQQHSPYASHQVFGQANHPQPAQVSSSMLDFIPTKSLQTYQQAYQQPRQQPPETFKQAHQLEQASKRQQAYQQQVKQPQQPQQSQEQLRQEHQLLQQRRNHRLMDQRQQQVLQAQQTQQIPKKFPHPMYPHGQQQAQQVKQAQNAQQALQQPQQPAQHIYPEQQQGQQTHQARQPPQKPARQVYPRQQQAQQTQQAQQIQQAQKAQQALQQPQQPTQQIYPGQQQGQQTQQARQQPQQAQQGQQGQQVQQQSQQMYPRVQQQAQQGQQAQQAPQHMYSQGHQQAQQGQQAHSQLPRDLQQPRQPTTQQAQEARKIQEDALNTPTTPNEGLHMNHHQHQSLRFTVNSMHTEGSPQRTNIQRTTQHNAHPQQIQALKSLFTPLPNYNTLGVMPAVNNTNAIHTKRPGPEDLSDRPAKRHAGANIAVPEQTRRFVQQTEYPQSELVSAKAKLNTTVNGTQRSPLNGGVPAGRTVLDVTGGSQPRMTGLPKKTVLPSVDTHCIAGRSQPASLTRGKKTIVNNESENSRKALPTSREQLSRHPSSPLEVSHGVGSQDTPTTDGEFNMPLSEDYPCVLCGGTQQHIYGCMTTSLQSTETNPLLVRKLVDESMDRNDPMEWRKPRRGPRQLPELESYDDTLSAAAGIVKNDKSYKEDRDLHNLQDASMVMTWAFKQMGGEMIYPNGEVWSTLFDPEWEDQVDEATVDATVANSNTTEDQSDEITTASAIGSTSNTSPEDQNDEATSKDTTGTGSKTPEDASTVDSDDEASMKKFWDDFILTRGIGEGSEMDDTAWVVEE